MKRVFLAALLAGTAIGLGSCADDPLGLSSMGAIEVQFVLPEDTLSVSRVATGDSTRSTAPASVFDAAAVLALDAVSVQVYGPTPKTVQLTLNEGTDRWEGTVDQLTPGTYRVVVRGLKGTDVDSYAEVASVSVTAGETSRPTATFGSFVPAVQNPASPTTRVRLAVTIGAVAGADGYTVQWANNAQFTGAQSLNTATTAADIGVNGAGAWFLRARATNDVVTNGAWSTAGTFTVTTDVDSTGSSDANTPLLGSYTIPRDSLFQLNILPAGDQDWFGVQACAGDTLLADVYAQRLPAPGSPLNARLTLKRSDLMDLSVVTDSAGTDPRLNRLLPVSGNYFVVVDGEGGSVGHYSFAYEVKKGPANTDTGCGDEIPNEVIVTPAGASILTVGGSAALAAEARDSLGQVLPGKIFTWASLNTAVATVAQDGAVTPVASGQTVISATADGVSGYAVITVAAPIAPRSTVWGGFNPGGSVGLTIWAAATDRVWVVGGNGTIGRYDGSSWSPRPSGVTDSLAGVWGFGRNLAYAVGVNGRILNTVNGLDWNTMTSPVSETLRAIWGADPGSVFAVGDNGAILRFNGASWAAMTSGTSNRLNAVWGSSSDNVYAVGASGTVVRYNGTAWSTVAGAPAQNLLGVWGTGPNAIYVVGAAGTVAMYNGTAWSPVAVPTTSDLRGIWGSAAGELYVVGGAGLLLQYNGTSWDSIPGPSTAAFNGVAGAPGGDVFLAGGGGTVLRGYRGATVAVTPGTANVVATGQTVQLAAAVQTAGAQAIAGASLIWLSSNTAVATVNASGLVTPVGEGNVNISARASVAADTTPMTVSFTFGGTLSASTAGFTDTLVITPGSLSWDGDETVTVAGVPAWIASQNASEIRALVPATPLGSQILEVGGQGAGDNLGQRAALTVDSTFAPQGSAAAAANITGGTFPRTYFVSVADTAAFHFERLEPGASMSLAVEVAWQTGANLDFRVTNATATTTINATGTTGSNPEVSRFVVPADSSWRLEIRKTGTGTPPTMARVTLDRTSIGTSIGVGYQHGCLLDLDGKAYCWGNNFYGQLGDSTLGDNGSGVPVPVSGGFTFTSIAVGRNYDGHTCALDANGAAYCWGANYYGQLGVGTFLAPPANLVPVVPHEPAPNYRVPRKPSLDVEEGLNFPNLTGDPANWQPRPISGGLTFSQLSAGAIHTCGVTTGGAVYCWGYGYYGQLGDNVNHTTSPYGSSTPVLTQAPVGVTFVKVSAGDYHTCALASSGNIYCWGYGYGGQLGDGNFSQAATPQLVTGGLLFADVTAGAYHSCGITTAGVAYCWGEGYQGQLGNNNAGAAFATPQAVLAAGPDSVFLNIAGGASHSCGITTQRTMLCWGANWSGQLGLGSVPPDQSLVPAAVVGGMNFAGVATGGETTCGVTTFGTTYCWGADYSGQTGTAPFPYSPQEVAAATDSGLHVPAAMGYHTCAVKGASSGQLRCWGYNYYGQLANGTRANTPEPTTVASGADVFLQVAGNELTTCAVRNDNRIRCAGYAYYGANGTGAASTVSPHMDSVPVTVTGAQPYAQVAVGYYHACAVTTGNLLYCWGRNNNGQLGLGTVTTTGGINNTGGVSTPTQVTMPGAVGVTQVSAGYQHTCAITSEATPQLYCWGYNYYGQLGLGGAVNTFRRDSLPRLVTGVSSAIDPVVSVRLGNYHTCARRQSGTTYCWGYGGSGALGTGATGSASSPQDVTASSGRTFTQLTAGAYFNCGIASAGGSFCWGENYDGQLGLDFRGDPQTTPQAIAGGLTFTRLSAGAYHTCGEAGGLLYCWGSRWAGQLGGSAQFLPSPTPIFGGFTARLRADE